MGVWIGGWVGLYVLITLPQAFVRAVTHINVRFDKKERKFILLNDASGGHWFLSHRLLDVKHMVIVTYLFRGNLLSPHRLLFLIGSKGSFICPLPQTGQHMPQPLMDQLWATGWNGK